jgi:RNA-directed DNA polymerase
MKEPYKKGIANHLGPESCAGSHKAGREALTGEKAGWAIEPRNGAYFREPTLSRNAEGNRMGVANARPLSPCAVEDPRHAWKLYAREPGDPSGARRRSNRRAGG